MTYGESCDKDMFSTALLEIKVWNQFRLSVGICKELSYIGSRLLAADFFLLIKLNQISTLSVLEVRLREFHQLSISLQRNHSLNL